MMQKRVYMAYTDKHGTVVALAKPASDRRKRGFFVAPNGRVCNLIGYKLYREINKPPVFNDLRDIAREIAEELQERRERAS